MQTNTQTPFNGISPPDKQNVLFKFVKYDSTTATHEHTNANNEIKEHIDTIYGKCGYCKVNLIHEYISLLPQGFLLKEYKYIIFY